MPTVIRRSVLGSLSGNLDLNGNDIFGNGRIDYTNSDAADTGFELTNHATQSASLFKVNVAGQSGLFEIEADGDSFFRGDVLIEGDSDTASNAPRLIITDTDTDKDTNEVIGGISFKSADANLSSGFAWEIDCVSGASNGTLHYLKFMHNQLEVMRIDVATATTPARLLLGDTLTNSDAAYLNIESSVGNTSNGNLATMINTNNSAASSSVLLLQGGNNANTDYILKCLQKDGTVALEILGDSAVTFSGEVILSDTLELSSFSEGVLVTDSSGVVTSSGTKIRSMRLGGNQFRKGSVAPTDVTIGTAPTIPALHFDATGELVSFEIEMPIDWDKGADVDIVLQWNLSAVETNADTLDVTIDYTAVEENTTGAGIAKTSTQTTGLATVTTANGLAIGDRYQMTITLDKDDANNGWSIGDDVVTLSIEFHLTNVTGVGEADLTSGALQYKALY